MYTAFKLLEKGGLAKQGGRGGSLSLLKPNEEAQVADIANKIVAGLGFPTSKVLDALSKRGTIENFDAEQSKIWWDKFLKLLQQDAENQTVANGSNANQNASAKALVFR